MHNNIIDKKDETTQWLIKKISHKKWQNLTIEVKSKDDKKDKHRQQTKKKNYEIKNHETLYENKNRVLERKKKFWTDDPKLNVWYIIIYDSFFSLR